MSILHEHIVLPLADMLTGQCVGRELHRLLRAEREPMPLRIGWQQQALRDMLRFAAREVPFYRRWFADGGLDPDSVALADLPIVDKATFRTHGIEAFLAGGKVSRGWYASHSNGTTDVPMPYYIDRRAHSVNTAAKLCTWYAAGYRLGDSYFKIAGGDRTGWLKRLQDRTNNSLYIQLGQIDGPTLRSILDAIESRRPQFLRTYPHMAYYLARERQRGNYRHHPRCIFTTGAILSPHMRRTITEAFGCDVIDSYSCEGVPNTAETPAHDGYHSCPEYGIVEVLDAEGRPVADGIGTVVATDLRNRAMPFLRYRTDDLVEVRGGTIVRVIGRANERLELPSGRVLLGRDVVPLLAANEDTVAAGQVRWHDRHLALRLVPTAIYSPSVGCALADRVSALAAMPVGEVQLVDHLPITRNGKHRTLTDE